MELIGTLFPERDADEAICKRNVSYGSLTVTPLRIKLRGVQNKAPCVAFSGACKKVFPPLFMTPHWGVFGRRGDEALLR